MLRPRCKILIEGDHSVYFDFCQSLEVKTSFDTLIDTAEVVLPNKINQDNIKIVDLIKRGDKITIELGYQTNFTTELNIVFSGYVAQVVPEVNLKLMCEDEGYIYKGVALKDKFYKQISLKNLIDDTYDSDYEINGDIPNLGDFKIERSPSFVDLLVALKSTYGITSYWRDGVLQLQPALNIIDKTTKFQTNYNMVDRGNLVYQEADKYAVVSECRSQQKDDTEVIWYAYYDRDQIITTKDQPAGRVSTMRVPNLSDSDVKKYAIDRLKVQVFNGYTGSFLAFGKPYVRHSEKITIIDPVIPDRDGDYLVSEVIYRLNDTGLRQEIYPKYKQ